MKSMIRESELPAAKVKIGMIGKDSGGDPAKVISIVPAKDWKKVKKYDKTGWLDWESISEAGIDPTTYLVAVKEWDGRTTVYIYGEEYEGFYVPTISQNRMREVYLQSWMKQHHQKKDPFENGLGENTIAEDTNLATVAYKTLVSLFRSPEQSIEKNDSVTKNYKGLKVTISKDPKPYRDLIYKAVCTKDNEQYEGYGKTVKEAISDVVFKIAVHGTFLSKIWG